MKKNILPILAAFAVFASGCGTVRTALESPDATATLSDPHVVTESGLVPESQVEPGTYAQNQVVDAGTYRRDELERLAPSPLPDTVSIQPGESPSMVETGLFGLGTVASSIPGGQPIGALLLGLVGVAKIWRDRRKINDLDAVARTLARTKDAALDSVAMLPDRAQAERLEAQILEGERHFASKLGKARDLMEAILKETETPAKRPINGSAQGQQA